MKFRITNRMIAERIYDKRKHGSGFNRKFVYYGDGDFVRSAYEHLSLVSPGYRKSRYIAPMRIDRVLDILNEMREDAKAFCELLYN